MIVKYWLRETKRDVAIKYALFTLLPVFSIFYSFRKLNTKSSYVVLFLVAALFGSAFSVQSGKSENVKLDSAHYRATFESYSNISHDQYMEGLGSVFKEIGKDYYFETVAYGVSRLTSNYHVFFMIIAIVFSYFSLKSLRFLTSNKDFRFTFECLILLFFFLKIQIIEINGVRFWTAYWISIYSIFQIYVNKNKRYYALALITPFFHSSYWVFIGVLLIIKITKKFDRIWVVLFFVSFFISSFAVELLQAIQPYLPPGLSRSISSYTSKEILNRTWTGHGWIPYLFSLIITIYYNFIIYLFIKNAAIIKSDNRTKELYSVLIIWVTIFNFFMFVPSLGSRYIQFIYPMIAFIWMISFKNVRYKLVLFCAPLVFFWEIIWLPFRYLAVLDIDVLVANPIFIIYEYLLMS